jgi:hypothetical protein
MASSTAITVAAAISISYIVYYLIASNGKTSPVIRFGGGFLLFIFVFAASHELMVEDFDLNSKWSSLLYIGLSVWALFYFVVIKRKTKKQQPQSVTSKYTFSSSQTVPQKTASQMDTGFSQYEIKAMTAAVKTQPDRGAISIERAFRIKDIVATAVQDESCKYGLFKRSSLKGLSIFEIDIALKVFIARMYRDQPETEEGFAKMKKIAGHCGAIFVICLFSFVRDSDILELENLPPESDEFKNKLSELMGNNSIKKRAKELSSSLETHESFLKFCKYIVKNDLNYWEKIYSHIGVFYHPGLLD